MSDKKEYIEMRFGPRWRYISTIRIFMQNFLAISIGQQKKADKISMAVSELVENAVKYADWVETYLRIAMDVEQKEVDVVVKNHCLPEQAEKLSDFLSKLNSLPPLDAYMEMMRESAAHNKSQLGLARIRYEAGAEIEAAYEDGFVVVTVAFKF